MKNLFLWGIVLIITATSCTEQLVLDDDIRSGPIELTFSASNLEMDADPITRSLVREGNKIYWVANDRISVIDAANVNNSFITKDGGLVTNFKGTVTAESVWYCALYPYNSQLEFDQDTYVFTTKLYTHQYAEPGSYASGMNLAVARSADGDAQSLGFYNSASYLKVTIPSDYSTDIYSMRLKGNGDELLAGDVTIPATVEEEMYARVIKNENASKIIYLDQRVEGQPCIKGKNYYFVLAPTSMENGFTLTLVNEEGKTAEINYPGKIDFERNIINSITLVDDVTFDGDDCGERTEDGLYIVNSLDCLYQWAECVNAGDYDLGCYITADIDFKDDERVWPQIGSEDHPFTGSIIGNGKTISNFKCEGRNQYAGFIAVMGEGGLVKDLSFESPTVISSYSGDVTNVEDDAYLGTIVGRLNKEDQFNYTTATIQNCHVTNPTLSGGENVGGIVGRSFGRNDVVKGCTVSGGSITGVMFVGGIIGNTEGIIEDCHVMEKTKVLSPSSNEVEIRLGGIVGTNNSGQIVACTANVIVSEIGKEQVDNLPARYIGGIAGANNGTIVACAVSGVISGSFSGAIAGESYGDIYASYVREIEASAVVYHIKRNMNDLSDVVKPTFKNCYGIGGQPTSFVVKGVEDGKIVDCRILGYEVLTQTEISNMNATIKDVAASPVFEYGQSYEYTENDGADKDIFPWKAELPQ